MLRWLSRPLVLLSLALLAGAAVVLFQGMPAPSPSQPLPVAGQDQEIAWLYPATSAGIWERFVAAIRRSADRWQGHFPGLEAEVTEATFPDQTTTIPEVALTLSRGGQRYVFRWYKLTSTSKTRDWVGSLLARKPPPLAVIGGSSSDAARELALQMARLTTNLPPEQKPLLLLTTATADNVLALPSEVGSSSSPATGESDAPSGVPLHRLYPERTFRFCFTNRQMAAVTSHFIWAQEDLRPDRDPVYLAQWNDDSYSIDLIDGFLRALRAQMARQTVGDWAWVTASIRSGLPAGLAGGSYPLLINDGFRFELPSVQLIDSSVGSFASPNRYEARVAGELLDTLAAQPTVQKRPLLILAAQEEPSRRFLRALVRAAPETARRFVVATGDGISFNTIYRDRQVDWPIQDLPCPLVFFCHHNPVDEEAGFRPLDRADKEDNASAASGTEDVLLFGEMVEALILANRGEAEPCRDPATLAKRLLGLRRREGQLRLDGEGVRLFTPEGQRRNGTGEHIVCLRPRIRGPRVLPEAHIEIWAWRRHEDGTRRWQQVRQPLTVPYGELSGEGDFNGGDE